MAIVANATLYSNRLFSTPDNRANAACYKLDANTISPNRAMRKTQAADKRLIRTAASGV